MIDLLKVLDEKISTLKQDLDTHIAARDLLRKDRKVGEPKKGKMTKAGKAKVAAAQKKRWAKFHANRKKK